MNRSRWLRYAAYYIAFAIALQAFIRLSSGGVEEDGNLLVNAGFPLIAILVAIAIDKAVCRRLHSKQP